MGAVIVTLADDIRAAVADVASHLDLTTSIGDSFLLKPAPPGSAHNTMKDHIIDSMVNINLWMVSSGWTFGDGSGDIDEPMTDFIQALNSGVHDLGELIEDGLEAIIEALIDIMAWLLDTVWTDVIVNGIFKWITYILVAGCRVVFGAPSYFLGKNLLEGFITKLTASDINDWLGEIQNWSNISVSPEDQPSAEFSSTPSHTMGGVLEGFLSTLTSTATPEGILESLKIFISGEDPSGQP